MLGDSRPLVNWFGDETGGWIETTLIQNGMFRRSHPFLHHPSILIDPMLTMLFRAKAQPPSDVVTQSHTVFAVVATTVPSISKKRLVPSVDIPVPK